MGGGGVAPEGEEEGAGRDTRVILVNGSRKIKLFVRYLRYSVRTESGRTYDRTNFLIRFFWGGFFLLLEYDPTLRVVFFSETNLEI